MTPAEPPADLAARDPRAYDARLSDLQRRGRLPSISAAIGRDGRLLWSGSVGGAPTPQPTTAYRIGSITKTLTAVLVLQLVDEGLVALDDPIGRHVPRTPFASAQVADLLAHTAGLPSEPAGQWWERRDGDDRTALFAAHADVSRRFPPGSRHHYSNLGYALLGALVEERREQTWWSAVQDRLVTPLAMTETAYHAPSTAAVGTSVDHFTGIPTPEPHADTRAMAPAGQLWSTPRDLLRWASVLVGQRRDILSARTAALMRGAHHPAPEYGLGVRLLTGAGRTWVGHTGSMPGFQAALFADPVTGDAVAVMCNATTGLAAHEVPEDLCGTGRGGAAARRAPWMPTARLPEEVVGMPGLWFWGNTAYSLEWWGDELGLRDVRTGKAEDRFCIIDGAVVGTTGYHEGERMIAHRDPSGSISHLECATFVYTRRPYDPAVPVSGGHPSSRG